MRVSVVQGKGTTALVYTFLPALSPLPQDLYEGLAGSVVLPVVPEHRVEEVRGAVKRHINRAWSGEAVRCGVGCAKAGESQRGRWEGPWGRGGSA